VNVPAGVKNGGRIRLAGQGSPGRGGQPGDLYLRIDIQPHAILRLEDLDLHTVIDISPWEAALGEAVKIPTLNGKVAVRIPTGSSSGRRIRLRGKGYPSSGGTPGDLYAEIRIVLPEKLSDREKELFEALRDETSFAPRSD
jgi:curved DNA-binding protein